jgi:hypothetical protein
MTPLAAAVSPGALVAVTVTAPPAPHRSARRRRWMDRWTVRSVWIAAVLAAGFLHGAHMATGMPAQAVTAPVQAAAREAGREARFERDALHGVFWRPAGSLAERPDARAFGRSSWRPATELADRD